MAETVVKYIRINKDICDALEAEAKRLHIKFPAVVGRALGEYVDRHNHTPTSTQVAYSPEMKQMLKEMSKDDLRTLSGQLEYLIRQEHERRQAPRILVDTPASYATEAEG